MEDCDPADLETAKFIYNRRKIKYFKSSVVLEETLIYLNDITLFNTGK